MLIGKPYEPPPAKFQPGDRVKFFLSDDADEHGTIHTVVDCDHCFAWIEGRKFGIPNYRLRRVHKARPKSTEESPKRDREDLATIDSKNLPTSGNLLKSTHPTGECSIYFSQIDLPYGFQLFKLFPKFKKLSPWKKKNE